MRTKASTSIVDSEVSPGKARSLLADVDRLRLDTRRAIGTPWFALLCFGAITIVAGALDAALGGWALAATWAFAGIPALVVVGYHHRARHRGSGVMFAGGRAWAWSASAFVICFGAAWAIGRAGGARGGVVASIVGVVIGYLLLGAWQRRREGPVAILAAAAPALLLAVLRARPWLIELSFGCALVAAGGVLWAAEWCGR